DRAAGISVDRVQDILKSSGTQVAGKRRSLWTRTIGNRADDAGAVFALCKGIGLQFALDVIVRKPARRSSENSKLAGRCALVRQLRRLAFPLRALKPIPKALPWPRLRAHGENLRALYSNSEPLDCIHPRPR